MPGELLAVLDEYATSCSSVRNVAVKDTLDRVAMDGSEKFRVQGREVIMGWRAGDGAKVSRCTSRRGRTFSDQGAGGREDQGRLRCCSDGAVGDGQGEHGGHGWSGLSSTSRKSLACSRATRGGARPSSGSFSTSTRLVWRRRQAGRHLRRGSQQQRGSVEPGAREGEGERDVRAGRDVRGGYHRDG